MSSLTINLLSALAISIVITAMVAVHSPRLKSMILVLPIQITIALLGTGGQATSLSIVGLALTNCFVWGIWYLHDHGWHILRADVLAVVAYVLIAFIFTKTVHVTFLLAIVLYLIVWALIVARLRHKTFIHQDQKIYKTSLVLRSIVIFGIAFGLFSMHQYLAAFVVTFPYNTMFAVYENRRNLFVQSALFTRNSIVLWAFFIANYLLTRDGAHWFAYFGSWAAFTIAIVIVSKGLQFKIKQQPEVFGAD